MSVTLKCTENCAVTHSSLDLPGWVYNGDSELVPYAYCAALVVVFKWDMCSLGPGRVTLRCTGVHRNPWGFYNFYPGFSPGNAGLQRFNGACLFSLESKSHRLS